MTATGYSGFVVGPPVIGFLAEALSLRAALLLPLLLCVLAALLAPALAGDGAVSRPVRIGR